MSEEIRTDAGWNTDEKADRGDIENDSIESPKEDELGEGIEQDVDSPSEDHRRDDQVKATAEETESVGPALGTGDSHLFAVRTTGGQEKVVVRLLETKMRNGELDIQSILLVDNLKGYIVVEAEDPQIMFNAIQGIRHVKGQLRGELQYSEIENYLIKKSTVSELAVDGIVEIIGGPFKGMKATITRVDHEKEEATVVLLDAPYQLPVTVDANYLKPSSA